MSTKTYTAEQQAVIDNFRNRFDNEAYCKAIEWLAGAEPLFQSRKEAGAYFSGVADAVAAIFNQGINTVCEDALFLQDNGTFRVSK